MPLNYYFVDIAQGNSDGLLLEMNGTGYIPDIALLDIRIPGIGGIELAKVLNHCAPECKIVFISSCIFMLRGGAALPISRTKRSGYKAAFFRMLAEKK